MHRIPTSILFLVVGLMIVSPCGIRPGQALTARADTAREAPVTGPSGYPVPRFVALRAGTVNLRRGPSTDHPIEWVYRNFRGLPVMVTAETEAWRRVRDHEGIEGWVHRGLLDGTRRALVTAERAVLRAEPQRGAPAVARLGQGAIGVIDRCAPTWCALDFSGVKGWMPRAGLWGVLPDEMIE